MNVGAEVTNSHNYLSIFFLILAAIDYTGLIDYSVKAFMGGLILLLFRILGDLITERLKTMRKDRGEK